MQLFLDNGNQHVSGHGALNLRLDCILAGAATDKKFNSQSELLHIFLLQKPAYWDLHGAVQAQSTEIFRNDSFWAVTGAACDWGDVLTL